MTRPAIMLTPKLCAVSNDCVAPLRPAVASMARAALLGTLARPGQAVALPGVLLDCLRM